MRLRRLIPWFAGVYLCLNLAVIASAQSQKEVSTKEGRLSGTVHMIDQESSSIIIRKGAVPYKVVYNAETKFTIQNKPGSIDDVIVGRQAICLGTFNDKTRLTATHVHVRTK